MPPKFGTSGLRGLLVELTEALVRDHVRSFLSACPVGAGVYVGRDLRPSSPEIAGWVIDEVLSGGFEAFECGALPTPALALAAMEAGAAAVMVTGSHIPADRNGLKFYTPGGEIGKSDEARILEGIGAPAADAMAPGARHRVDAMRGFQDRYGQSFSGALTGMRIGVYQHSSVARDLLMDLLAELGAEVVALARSETFIPVDTEAVDPETRAQVAAWVRENRLHAVVSTDGDADRPMVVDDLGRAVPGDVLGALSARALGAEVLCTPVSSNTMVDEGFGRVVRTKIGSPFVVAAMEAELAQDRSTKVIGYEANGGLLLGFKASGPTGPVAPLMTRDCVLPILAPLAAAARAGKPLSELVDALPPRFTAADRIVGVPSDAAKALLALLKKDPSVRTKVLATDMPLVDIDETDGLRLSFEGGEIVHLRPSGNAPEFRCYIEADSIARAQELLAAQLELLKHSLASSS